LLSATLLTLLLPAGFLLSALLLWAVVRPAAVGQASRLDLIFDSSFTPTLV
jgi:hypothetical protein